MGRAPPARARAAAASCGRRSTAITGLAPNTTYHYRTVGSNARVRSLGLIRPSRRQWSPRRRRLAGVCIGDHAAYGHASRRGQPREQHLPLAFGVRHTTAYGIRPPVGFSLRRGTDQAVAAQLMGLEPDTPYHFRVVADDVSGPPAVRRRPDVLYRAGGRWWGTGRHHEARQAEGTINAHGAATTYHFNYGPTSTYGSSTAEVDGGTVDGDRAVSEQISGLLPDTIYHVQVVATTADVVRWGADGLFRTRLRRRRRRRSDRGIHECRDVGR